MKRIQNWIDRINITKITLTNGRVFIPWFVGISLLSACKNASVRPSSLDSSPLSTPSMGKVAEDCAARNPSPLMARLTSFKFNGVRPYLSCPYQSEWSVYPNYFLKGERKGEFRDWMVETFKSLEAKSSLSNKLLFTDRYEFYTVVMGEGLAQLFDLASMEVTDGTPSDDLTGQGEPTKDIAPEPHVAINSPNETLVPSTDKPRIMNFDPRRENVPGFGILGTDWFGAEFPKLKNKAYAKPYIGDFVQGREFKTANHTNERNENVLSADFENLEIGLKAFAAIYLERRQMYLEDSKSCLGSISNHEDTKAYWTYYYFRRPAEAKAKLCAGGGKVPTARPEEDGEHPKTISIQCLKRIATKKFLQQEKALD